MFSYIVNLLTLTFCTSLVNGIGIYYETPTVHACPSKYYSCCIISECQAAWTLLRAGKQPQVCGMLNRTPLVCCPHYIHQELDHINSNSHYLDQDDQEPHYVLHQPHFILRTSTIEEENPQFVVRTPSTIKFLSPIEDLPSSVRLPIVRYLPSSQRKLPVARNLPSNGKILPVIRFSFGNRLPSSERRLRPTGDDITSVGYLPYSEKELPTMEEETNFNDETVPSAGDLPFNERISPPMWEETPLKDNEAPSVSDIPSNDRKSPPIEEETPFKDDETPSVDDSLSNERGLSPMGEETLSKDDEAPTVGDLPSEERRSPPIEKEIPSSERRRPSAENPSIREMRPRPAERRKRLKISPPGRPSPINCGRRKVDRSSDLPEGSPRTIETDSPETTIPAPEEEDDDVFEISVVGGARANDKWAWMAGIFNRNSTMPFCGGAVIDDRHIITAAHCFLRRGNLFLSEPGRYVIKVGQIDLSEQNPSYEIEEIKTHEDYQPNFTYDDIAIIRLNESLPADTVPVCVPEKDNLSQDDNVTVLGWGRLTFGGRSSSALQQADGIPVVSNEECNRNYSTLPGDQFPNGIIDSMLCAGLAEGGIDACQGDSGGPLLREFRRNRWALVGIVSFGRRCAEPGFPGIYTRVANYLSWITEYIDESKRRNDPSSDVSMEPQ